MYQVFKNIQLLLSVKSFRIKTNCENLGTEFLQKSRSKTEILPTKLKSFFKKQMTNDIHIREAVQEEARPETGMM